MGKAVSFGRCMYMPVGKSHAASQQGGSSAFCMGTGQAESMHMAKQQRRKAARAEEMAAKGSAGVFAMPWRRGGGMVEFRELPPVSVSLTRLSFAAIKSFQ